MLLCKITLLLLYLLVDTVTSEYYNYNSNSKYGCGTYYNYNYNSYCNSDYYNSKYYGYTGYNYPSYNNNYNYGNYNLGNGWTQGTARYDSNHRGIYMGEPGIAGLWLVCHNCGRGK